MECSKEFEIEILASCSGLASNVDWTYNPNSNPGQPPAGLALTDNVIGYAGTWQAIKAAAPSLAVAPNLEWRVAWTSAAGPTLTVKHTVVGSFDRTGQVGGAVNVVCRADANGNIVNTNVMCAAGVVTPINLQSIAQDVSLGGAAFIDCFVTFNATTGTFSVSGTIEVSCA